MPMLLLNVMTSWCLVTVLHCSVWGAGVWPLLALGTHELLPSSATLLSAADIPHHIISVLQTMNNYLPSRLSSPSSTLALHWLVLVASARYSGQLIVVFLLPNIQAKMNEKMMTRNILVEQKFKCNLHLQLRRLPRL